MIFWIQFLWRSFIASTKKTHSGLKSSHWKHDCLLNFYSYYIICPANLKTRSLLRVLKILFIMHLCGEEYSTGFPVIARKFLCFMDCFSLALYSKNQTDFQFTKRHSPLMLKTFCKFIVRERGKCTLLHHDLDILIFMSMKAHKI